MTSPARLEQDDATKLAPPRVSQATELPALPVDLGELMRVEQANLHRDVLLWQRWVRYLAIGTMVLLSLAYSSAVQAALIPITVMAACYYGVVLSTSLVIHRSPAARVGALFPGVLLATDIAALAGFCYLTSPPAELYRILLLGFLSMQLGVFYFGRAHGWIAAGLTIAAYLVFTLAVGAYVPGPAPSAMSVAFNTTLFAIIAAVLVHTFGNFRERIDALRVYCKVIEKSEFTPPPPIRFERYPDDLTLLAASFQSMHARLAEQVGSDALTGCLNRRSFEARLKADLRQARRRSSTVAIAAIDLDHFKEINDTRGHLTGDVVLQQLANIMKTTARDTDAVARYGGDEFVVVLPDTGWQGALTFADRLRRRVDDFSFGPPDTPPLGVTISVGVALGRGSDPMSTEGLLQEADAALYRAKTAGRNRVFS
ncbi:MAG: diguanylate cyclase [Gemmatimonadaceae bacterium]